MRLTVQAMETDTGILEDLERKTAMVTRPRFEELVDELALPPKQAAYVKATYPKRLSDPGDAALKALIAEQIEDYRRAEHILADPSDLTKAANNPLLEEDLEGSEPPRAGHDDADDLAKAANNPLLEEDFDE